MESNRIEYKKELYAKPFENKETVHGKPPERISQELNETSEKSSEKTVEKTVEKRR